MAPDPTKQYSTTITLHGLNLTFQTAHAGLHRRFDAIYGHLPRTQPAQEILVIDWQLAPGPAAPLPPPVMPAISRAELVSYFGDDQLVAIRMPKYGLIMVDLAAMTLHGQVTENCLTIYGAFEDVMMIALAPLYRRRGWFPLHAFAALAPGGKAILITGAMGAGKTTSGLALLDAGWKLLSNDSPLLHLRPNGLVEALAYPGRLSAFDDSLARFDRLKKFIPAEQPDAKSQREKRTFRAEEAFDQPWAKAGLVGSVFFPKIVKGLEQSKVEAMGSAEAMLHLMPQAIEGWDKAVIAQNLHLLAKLVEQAPCYWLHLSPHVEQLPDLLNACLGP